MSVETRYTYDEPLGIYGHESHERLARGVLRDLIRYDETLNEASAFSDMPDLGVNTAPHEEFRISSIVESRTDRFGYALAVARPNESDKATMGGVFYYIDREDPGVVNDKGLLVARPETFHSNRDYNDEIDSLMNQFDKVELEAIMRMLGKMTTSVELSHEMHIVNEDDLDGLSVAGRMKREAEIQRSKNILSRVASVEPFVLSALHNHRQQEIRILFPENQPFSERKEGAGNDNEHILDWEEFTDAANKLIDSEADPSLDNSHINMHYEVGSKLYYIKLAAERGQLSGVQVLCDDTGAWKSQIFEIDMPDEDAQAGINIVSPIWDKADILKCLEDGETIDSQGYEYYRMLAETSIRDAFGNPDNLINISPSSSKKPAA